MGAAVAAVRPKVLSAEGLDHIAAHKYVAGKYTPLDLLLNPAWLKMAEMLPVWLAPNLVTLLGFLPMALSYMLAWRASPDFVNPPSQELALFTSLAVFFYQTMDAVDGKQARRTGSSTPLGQLFDHGCDCLACLSHHSVASMFLLPGRSRWGISGLCALQSGFFMAQWQEYHTGVLRTSFGAIGVTETQWFLIFLSLLGGLAGPERAHALATTPLWPGGPAPGLAVCKGWVAFCCMLMIICLKKTTQHVYATKGPGGGMKGVFSTLAQLLPILLMNSMMWLWEPTVIRHSARKYCFITGLLFFYLTAQMILFSMAKMPFPIFQPTLLGYGSLVVISWYLPVGQLSYALGAVAIVEGLWILLWLHSVIEELKEKLGIMAFTIKSKPA